MKILGTGDNSYFVEIKTKELFRLIGYYSEYSEKRPKIGIGDEIDIHGMYEQLYYMSTAVAEIEKAKETFARCGKMLNTVVPIIKNIGSLVEK